jgi:hypothetical protein
MPNHFSPAGEIDASRLNHFCQLKEKNGELTQRPANLFFSFFFTKMAQLTTVSRFLSMFILFFGSLKFGLKKVSFQSTIVQSNFLRQ